jgi:cytochrome c oxidase subunit 4
MVWSIITVAASRVDFGSANLLIAMLIASVKASLVIAIFMHVKWDTAINKLVFLSSFLFLSLLLIFTLSDQATRGDDDPLRTVKLPVDNGFVQPKPHAENH